MDMSLGGCHKSSGNTPPQSDTLLAPVLLSNAEWVQLQQTARGLHKRNLNVYREEGYTVAVETDSPTPV